MERITEPELMDDLQQAFAYANADFEEPHQFFIETFKEVFADEEITGDVLDLGCGPADITIRFAKAFPQTFITGIDGAEAMLKLGRERLIKENLDRRVNLTRGYIPEVLSPNDLVANTIISNAFLHHLHNPEIFWDHLQKYIKTETRVFIMDLARPDTVDQAKNLVETYAENEPEILKRDFYNSLCAAFTPEEVSTQLKSTGIKELKIRTISDRHMIVYGQLKYAHN